MLHLHGPPSDSPQIEFFCSCISEKKTEKKSVKGRNETEQTWNPHQYSTRKDMTMERGTETQRTMGKRRNEVNREGGCGSEEGADGGRGDASIYKPYLHLSSLSISSFIMHVCPSRPYTDRHTHTRCGAV